MLKYIQVQMSHSILLTIDLSYRRISLSRTVWFWLVPQIRMTPKLDLSPRHCYMGNILLQHNIIWSLNQIVRNLYSRLFDPRVQRAAVVGPNAQAEGVVGTHLYSFFCEQCDDSSSLRRGGYIEVS
jgi:hypothetical protein